MTWSAETCWRPIPVRNPDVRPKREHDASGKCDPDRSGLTHSALVAKTIAGAGIETRNRDPAEQDRRLGVIDGDFDNVRGIGVGNGITLPPSRGA